MLVHSKDWSPVLNAVNQCLEDTLGVGVWPGEAQPEHPRHLGLQQPQLGTREGPESAGGQLATLGICVK